MPLTAKGMNGTEKNMQFQETELLNIAFEMDATPSGPTVFLLHGWPDASVGWKQVASRLRERGFRAVMPCLRGSYPTEFRSKEAPRFAAAVAMAQDVIDLADRLGISRFVVIGHDWGARIAYTLAALFPERVRAIAALALAYQPRAKRMAAAPTLLSYWLSTNGFAGRRDYDKLFYVSVPVKTVQCWRAYCLPLRSRLSTILSSRNL
jgi:pimeloyl-ACP methyl ester carboxylesterase